MAYGHMMDGNGSESAASPSEFGLIGLVMAIVVVRLAPAWAVDVQAGRSQGFVWVWRG